MHPHEAGDTLILSFSPRGEGTPEAPSHGEERVPPLPPSPLGEWARVRGSSNFPSANI
jgi:hypothetical protein